MSGPVLRSRLSLWGVMILFCLSGCGGQEQLQTSYGRVRGKSINGTGVFAELLRQKGNTVRTAVRLTPELEEWANVIVRFAPYPGPPGREEAAWYASWLAAEQGRRLIYVPCDFDASAEYWGGVVERLPSDIDPEMKKYAKRALDNSSHWHENLPPRPKEVANSVDWFAVSKTKEKPVVCKTLGGPWAEEVKADDVSLTRHESLEVTSESVLLEGDGLPLVIDWTQDNGSQVLVLANGSFLLNFSLVKPERRPLALLVRDWVGDTPAQVAFVEGRYLIGEQQEGPNVFSLLGVWPFGWVAGQLMLLGLVACLARAPRLGRARLVSSAGNDRPVAHPQALGLLLAKTRQVGSALAMLETYRHWRLSTNPFRASSLPSLTERPESKPSLNSESSPHE